MKVSNQADVYKHVLFLPWDELPEFMRTDKVRPYWEILNRRRLQLVIKRAFDVIMSMVMIAIFTLPMLIICVAIKLDSIGPVLYRQVRVTQYGREFKISKFRTMYESAIATDISGNQGDYSVTVKNDLRITKVGRILRKYRLDEFPQLFNVLMGDMSFVGTRPEVPKYVEEYRDEWNATLLLPPGITSECSIRFKDEDRLLDGTSDVDKTYIEIILPKKMKINLWSLWRYSFMHDIGTMLYTVMAVMEQHY